MNMNPQTREDKQMTEYKNKAEEFEVEINKRCFEHDYPNLSDLLGSGWMRTYPLEPCFMKSCNPEQYRRLAIRFAHWHYSERKAV